MIERILETKIATNIEAVVWGLTLTCYNIYQKKKISEIFENFQKTNHLNIFFYKFLTLKTRMTESETKTKVINQFKPVSIIYDSE